MGKKWEGEEEVYFCKRSCCGLVREY